jgi:HD-GYP domain-containing protein (c-di-GMP phosphodiesterase class II)
VLLDWISPGISFVVAAAALAVGIFASRQARNRLDELEQLKGQMLEWNRRLESKVSERTQDLELAHRRLQETYLETVTSLVEALTAKDTYLFGHSHSVATYARAIGEEMGFSRDRLDRLVQGCELHDVGKIAVPDTILMKPGPLNKEEFEIVKQHPLWGARILEPLTFMKDIGEMVHQEHERWDGTGYPQGLKGDQIRLEARMIAVADALDAMISDRPYRQSIGLERASQELHRCAGTQFDTLVVDACLRAIRTGKIVPLSHEQIHSAMRASSSQRLSA